MITQEEIKNQYLTKLSELSQNVNPSFDTISKGTDWWVKANVLGAVLSNLTVDADSAIEGIAFFNAVGYNIDYWLALLFLQRRSAGNYAYGQCNLPTVPTAAIRIPINTPLYINKGASVPDYVTLEEYNIPIGAAVANYPINIRSYTIGSDKTLAAGSLLYFASAITGIDHLVTIGIMQDGTSVESDSNCINRLLSSLPNFVTYGNVAYYNKIALAQVGITGSLTQQLTSASSPTIITNVISKDNYDETISKFIYYTSTSDVAHYKKYDRSVPDFYLTKIRSLILPYAFYGTTLHVATSRTYIVGTTGDSLNNFIIKVKLLNSNYNLTSSIFINTYSASYTITQLIVGSIRRFLITQLSANSLPKIVYIDNTTSPPTVYRGFYANEVMEFVASELGMNGRIAQIFQYIIISSQQTIGGAGINFILNPNYEDITTGKYNFDMLYDTTEACATISLIG